MYCEDCKLEAPPYRFTDTGQEVCDTCTMPPYRENVVGQYYAACMIKEDALQHGLLLQEYRNKVRYSLRADGYLLDHEVIVIKNGLVCLVGLTPRVEGYPCALDSALDHIAKQKSRDENAK